MSLPSPEAEEEEEKEERKRGNLRSRTLALRRDARKCAPAAALRSAPGGFSRCVAGIRPLICSWAQLGHTRFGYGSAKGSERHDVRGRHRDPEAKGGEAA